MLLRGLTIDHRQEISFSDLKRPRRLANQLSLSLEPLRVTDVLRDLQASTIPERAISITLAVDESLHVNADKTLLSSAVGHLLRNAVKFSGDGACVTLSCHADDDGAVIEIEDECGGLTDHESARLSSTFAARPVGQGRGLALAQRDVEAMAGRISLKNEPNHGCTFRLTFPPAQPPRSMPWQQRDAG